MPIAGNVVLSRLEFDVLWERERLPRRHVALDVASPGETHAERAELAEQAWDGLAGRGLAIRGRAGDDLLELLNLLAHPQVAIDVWLWADHEVSALAVSQGGQALLAVLDGEQVWLIPAREAALPEAAVSVLGDWPAGPGRSVSLPHEALRRADASVAGDPKSLITALRDRGVALGQAQDLAAMLAGQQARAQFGAQRTGRDRQVHRAGRVIACYDTAAGRYLLQLGTGADGRDWATIAPADNNLLVRRVRELLDEPYVDRWPGRPGSG